MGRNLRLQILKTPQAFFNKWPAKQRNLIFMLPKLLTTEDQNRQSDQISVLCKYIRPLAFSNHSRPRNVKEANNQVIFHPDSECLRTVAETPVLDDLRIVWAGVTFSRSSSCAYPQKLQKCSICVDTQIFNSGEELFCVRSQKLQYWMICVSCIFLAPVAVHILRNSRKYSFA